MTALMTDNSNTNISSETRLWHWLTSGWWHLATLARSMASEILTPFFNWRLAKFPTSSEPQSLFPDFSRNSELMFCILHKNSPLPILSSARVSPVRWGASVGITLFARPRVWGAGMAGPVCVCLSSTHGACPDLSETQLCSAQVFTGWTLERGHWTDTDKILKKCYAKCAVNMAFSTKAQKFNKLRWSVDENSKGLQGICDCQELVSRGETFKPWIVAREFRGHFCFTGWHGTLFTKELRIYWALN